MTTIRPDQSAVFHRELDREYPVMVRGGGYRIYDDGGREYLDAIGGGAAVVNIGFGLPDVIQALARQAEILPFVHNQKFTSPPQEELARVLIEHAPDYAKVIFCQGGAEANETALRLVRSFHAECGDDQRWAFISVAQAYHGSTIGTLALTKRPASLTHPYEPYLPSFLHIPPVDPSTDPDGSRALSALEDAIRLAGAETVAAFWCEPVSAAAAPALRAPDSFYAGVAELAQRHGFLVVFDEVVTGLGRTGSFLAADQMPITPDIVTTAKGLGGGYIPMGAVLATQRVYDAIAAGSKDFSHGHTFNGYPLGCAVGLAMLQHLDEHRLIERVARKGPDFLNTLRETLTGCPFVDEIRGQGFLFGITYRDDEHRFLDPSLRLARRIDVAALGERLLVYSTQPTADGYMGDQTMLAPSFETTDEDFAEIARRLSLAIARAAADIKEGRPLELVLG